MIEVGDVVRTAKDGCGKALGERGNWRARGALVWIVTGRAYDRRFESTVRIELMPLDTRLVRKHPLCVDEGLCIVVSKRVRITA